MKRVKSKASCLRACIMLMEKQARLRPYIVAHGALEKRKCRRDKGPVSASRSKLVFFFIMHVGKNNTKIWSTWSIQDRV